MNDITTAESRRFDGSEPDRQQIERVKKYEEYLDEAKALLSRARSVKNKKGCDSLSKNWQPIMRARTGAGILKRTKPVCSPKT